MIESERADGEGAEVFNKRSYKQRGNGEENYAPARGAKKPGATKVLNQLLTSDFFNAPHSSSSIANYCKETFDSDFKTSELSGILLKLANEHKLKRERSHENNRFEYVRA